MSSEIVRYLEKRIKELEKENMDLKIQVRDFVTELNKQRQHTQSICSHTYERIYEDEMRCTKCGFEM